MSFTDDRRAMAALWIVTAFFTLVFAGFVVMAIVEEPFAALYGLAGLLVGGLLAACISITLGRGDSAPARQERLLEALAERLESLEALAERLESLEAERGRVMELEDRVDFAERLLAKERSAHQLEGKQS